MPTQINITISPSELGLREKEWARLMPGVRDQALKEMAKKAADIFRRNADQRNIRRTGAYIRGWGSRKLASHRYEAASYVPHSIYVELYHKVVTLPANQTALRRMVREVAEKYIDQAMKRAYRR